MKDPTFHRDPDVLETLNELRDALIVVRTVLVPHETDGHRLGKNHKESVDKTPKNPLGFDHKVKAGENGNPTSTYLAGSTFYGVETDAFSNHVDHHHEEVPTCKRNTENN